MNPTISLNIPAKADYIDVVRLTLFGVANKAGFSYEEIEDMKVAVTEACSNAVLHAYSHQQEGSIAIRFEHARDGMSIRIRDEGSGCSCEYEPLQASLHGKALSEVSPGGLGIFMMHALMDKVEVRTGKAGKGTEVILTKRFVRKEEMA